MSAATIARLKITLDHVEPTVLRRVEVPLSIRLDRLHLTIQAAMGWTNSHLYEILAGNARSGWGIPDPDGDMLDAKKTRLVDALEGTRKLRYLYDFGDGWEHTIKVERRVDAAPGILYPRLIDAIGRCPPEDVGGPWGYDEFLAAMRDPKHERHAEFTEWFSDDFDPDTVDLAWLDEEVTALAKQWSRKPAKRARRS
jgi:hypothetical protein